MYDNAPLILRIAKNTEGHSALAQKVLGGMENVQAVADFWEQNGLLFQLIAQNEMQEFFMTNDEITQKEIAAFKYACKRIAEFMILCYTESEKHKSVTYVTDSEEDLPSEPTE